MTAQTSTTASPTKLEVEIKFRVADAAALNARLPALGFQLQTPRTFEHNRLFDTPERTLRSKGQTLRIRKYGETCVVTHKAPLPNGVDVPHKQRLETETTVEDGEALATVFSSLGYQVTFVYEKWRTEYSEAHGHLVLDETPLGTFVELEGPAEWIDATAAQLGITTKDYMTASYARLFLEWKQATQSTANNLTFTEVAGAVSR
ncbi:MAG TPA: class IV adenylate cyclase [Acidobacteriaceae bacterium]|nr:class IV adenylate cyclase [Acidobacteriaceae bacterium]